MSDLPKEEVIDVLGDLAKVTNATQFLNGVQKNPELVFEAVKTLAQQSVGEGTAASQLEKAYKEILEKEQQLLDSAKELEDAKKGLKNLENSSETNIVLGKLADVLGRLQLPGQKSAPIHSGAVFNGDKKLFPTWKEGILLKLRSNIDHFPTDQSKMAFVYSMLDQDCQSHLHGYIKDGVINFGSLDIMMNELTILFDDPNRVRDAIARLHANNQRNKPFSAWIAEIRRDAAIAGYENTRELRNIVFLNLSLELQQALIYERDIYALDFNEAISRLQDIDNRIQTFSRNLARHNTRANQSSWPKNLQSLSTPLTTTQGGDAMDLSAVSSQHRGPLSDEEKDRRRQLNLCYYCGKKGHRVMNCTAKTSHQNSNNKLNDILDENVVKESGNGTAP